ncbi:MAG: HipA domain-containing protein [Spirochaetota bacterium]
MSKELVALLGDREVGRLTRLPGDAGQFSLAGAQPKTALLFDGARWGVPSGRLPTTHILKPPSGDLDGHPENEHFCQTLARRVGLAAAHSRILRFREETAIVVERYDRYRAGSSWERVHQEDACQALGVLPQRTYENEGGPGTADLAQLIAEHSSRSAEDGAAFADALAFSWIIAGTDAHAKNYSLLLAGGGQVRLAPLYDLASALPYPELDPQRLKLAMKIGAEYRLRRIGRAESAGAATRLRRDERGLIDRVRELAAVASWLCGRRVCSGSYRTPSGSTR